MIAIATYAAGNRFGPPPVGIGGGPMHGEPIRRLGVHWRDSGFV